VDGFHTIGQPAAVAAVHAMLGTHVPHAVLLVGPASVGKHTLALDLAAALLCTGDPGAGRPCRACRGCRMVEHGNHPDLHSLAPVGPGNQIRIGEDQHPEPGTIRRLAIDLALLPVEGGERVAIIRDAGRMNDVAQSALLKTLEEPPPSTTLVLCVDDEEQLLPTIRSRCARIRLGTLATRDVERLLDLRQLADPPMAARLARLAAGRPGVAIAYAMAPGAEAIRAELVRSLLDLLGCPRAERLAASKGLLGRAMALAAALGGAPGEPAPAPAPAAPGMDPEAGAGKVSAAERRRALALLLDLWRDLTRDLACAGQGAVHSIRDVALLEEIEAAAARLPEGSTAAALARLVRAGELLDVNTTPELILDVLLVRWPTLVAAR
jgi:DNA polymerase-3 subunit delta'